MDSEKDAPLRSDAQRNRERILEVALVELTNSADAPLSAIAKKAGVGQGTFYRNFPNREALVLEVYRHEVQQVADAAAQLLKTRAPDRALREWMDRLAQYGMAKAGLADALRSSTVTRGTLTKLGHGSVRSAVTLLLEANEEAGTIRPGVTHDDFMLAIAGLWQLDPHADWQPRAARLLDLVMDGLRAGAPASGGTQAQGSGGTQAQGSGGTQAQGSGGTQAQGSGEGGAPGAGAPRKGPARKG